jgi:hypothetical protein
LKLKEATIIITRTVLMELSPNSYNVHQIQVQYLKELHDSGLKLILFDEELIFDCLNEILKISILDANLLLGYAIKEVSRFKTKTYEILNSMPKSVSYKLKGTNPGNTELYSNFFEYARTSKIEQDSLAEELMFICIIVLSKIPLEKKFIYLSDDLNARTQIITIRGYIEKHHYMKVPYQLTTAAMVYKMYKENILTEKGKMIDILKCAYNENAKIFYVGEFDIQQVTETFECVKIADKILCDKEFRVLY